MSGVDYDHRCVASVFASQTSYSSEKPLAELNGPGCLEYEVKSVSCCSGMIYHSVRLSGAERVHSAEPSMVRGCGTMRVTAHAWLCICDRHPLAASLRRQRLPGSMGSPPAMVVRAHTQLDQHCSSAGGTTRGSTAALNGTLGRLSTYDPGSSRGKASPATVSALDHQHVCYTVTCIWSERRRQAACPAC